MKRRQARARRIQKRDQGEKLDDGDIGLRSDSYDSEIDEEEKEAFLQRIEDEKTDFNIIKSEADDSENLALNKAIDRFMASTGKQTANEMQKAMHAAIKVHQDSRNENEMSKRDQIDFIGCVPRTLFEKGPNWQFDDWVKHMLEKGPHIDKLTELPRLSFFTGKEKLIDPKKGEF